MCGLNPEPSYTFAAGAVEGNVALAPADDVTATYEILVGDSW